MQLDIIILLLGVGILTHDQIVHDPAAAPLVANCWALLGSILLPKLLLGCAYAWACRVALDRLGTPRAGRAMRRLERLGAFVQYAAVALYLGDLYLGGLRWARIHVGDLILVNEVLFMAPTLLLIASNWWAYYPIDRRLRNATLLARLDDGLPIHPVWTRRQYMLAQLRHQVLLVLTPLLLVMGWLQLVEHMHFPERVERYLAQCYAPAGTVLQGSELRLCVSGAGLLVILLLTPLLIRHLWDTAPLPPGPLRDRLVRLCRQYRVGVREVLLWRTFGGMVNGAVMGLVGQVRYILLTDALLEMTPPDQVEAVMAHELAHVRKHHLFWLLFVSMGAMSLATLGATLGFAALVYLAQRAGLPEHLPAWLWGLADNPEHRAQATLLIDAACWWPVFRWVSQRFERQADTFAVQHLARQRAAAAGQTAPVHIDGDSASVMVEALQSVADLNNISIHRGNWRHGSIAGRQDYLRSLVGRPVDGLAIDRMVVGIKIAAVAAVVLMVSATLWLPARYWV